MRYLLCILLLIVMCGCAYEITDSNQLCTEYKVQRSGPVENVANRLDGAFNQIFEHMVMPNESSKVFQTQRSTYVHGLTRIPYSYVFMYTDRELRLTLFLYDNKAVTPGFIEYTNASMVRFMDRSKQIFDTNSRSVCTRFH